MDFENKLIDPDIGLNIHVMFPLLLSVWLFMTLVMTSIR